MAIPKNKLELQLAIQQTYANLQRDLAKVPFEKSRDKVMEGHAKGTLMSPCDLVAYLLGWGTLVLKWQRQKESGETVVFPEVGYQWNELGRLAQQFYKDYEKESYSVLLERLDARVKEILQLIASLKEETLYVESFYGKYPLGRMIQLNTSSPYKNARTRIRKYLRTLT